MAFEIAIVGTGWVAEKHIAAIGKIGGARVAAIAGRNAPRLAELCSSCGARPYSDYREMLDKERPSAAFILLPPHLHGEVELACAERVPAVLVEKPVERDLAAANRIMEAFARAGTFAAAAYMNRCRASVERTRALFAAPNSAPILVEGRWVGDMPSPPWWRDRALSGGQFVEQCTHLVDIARFVAGEIAEVSAFAASGRVDDVEGYATDDAMTVELRFASGALGSFSTGCYARPGLYAEGGISMEISSRDARCSLSGWDMRLVARRWKGAAHPIETETVGGEEDIFEVEDRLFIEAAATGLPSRFPSTYADAVRTLAVTLAANESAATGRVVRVEA
jgi:myo-inositol 2-dehydrogenase / D-chiro-inositol 1-dehydrogenase